MYSQLSCYMSCHQHLNGYPTIYDVQELNETTPDYLTI